MSETSSRSETMEPNAKQTREQSTHGSASRPMQTMGDSGGRAASSVPATRGAASSPSVPSAAAGRAEDTKSADQDVSLSVIRAQVGILNWKLRETWTPTAEQTAALSAPIDPEWVEVKYPNVPYLPGAYYRMIFDKAFGIGGWELIEAGQPHKSQDGYYQGFVFKVGQVPIKKVAGYMAQRGNNDVLTPGIALEGMRTNAIMRVAKDLGVARELWFPAWTRKWLREYCVEVDRTRTGIPILARKDDSTGFDTLSYEIEAVRQATAEQEYGEGTMAHMDEIRRERPTRRRTSQAAKDARTMETIGNLEQLEDSWGDDMPGDATPGLEEKE